MNEKSSAIVAFGKLLDIMDELRQKCPWDQKQTLESLRRLTIEETYELGDAILSNDLEEIRNELGDLLLHIVFYAKIGSEKKAFDISSVIEGINEKLIKRHPHVYGNIKVKDEEEVKQNWERIKLAEGKTSVLEGVPKSLPALIKACRMQEKAAGVGFDWDNSNQVWEKVKEEWYELEQAVEENIHTKKEEEFGDLLFSLVNYARFLDIDPESALERTNLKFIHRFTHLEKRAKEIGKNLKEISLDEMNGYWEEAKKNPRPGFESNDIEK